MSGSGSAVFGLADSEKHANEIKTAVEKSSSCDCFVARTITGSGESPLT
jgi:4-diphosphocytidyl-2C-methyl-D-erythritol kinase